MEKTIPLNMISRRLKAQSLSAHSLAASERLDIRPRRIKLPGFLFSSKKTKLFSGFMIQDKAPADKPHLGKGDHYSPPSHGQCRVSNPVAIITGVYKGKLGPGAIGDIARFS